ncbi:MULTISPECIES: PIN domain-containing protein [Rhizobium]|uniref:PIN domain-containing protein n=1 Tax=Rhizobium TaxID=379 RepID=UPI0007EA3AB9|nr:MULTISPECIES: PIN domain-containing protein [Rhizobium]ANK94207.1 PilT domain-containing protein [Rhizobium sp. N6212]ANL00257.1 PilT domain-containing protein [Rhizobium sp. N621]ANL06382.1 PilT domain-containing protein [Rhizobium esperanzae]ANL12551.1 PilT domain-containing protein [Rhizobium sp. N1341]ANL24516.1 PilT domain-containing protein [Rhizobium sp. N113]
MASKPPVAVYDACVLYPFHLRNVLVQCAFDGLVDARWTDDIHAEWIRNLAIGSPEIPFPRLEATRDRIKKVLPDADVGNHRILIPDLSLPDPDDRHVLAAAIAGKASVIVTWNLKDFPAADLRPHGVACVSPDNFLVGLHSTFSSALIDSIRRARLNLRKTVPAVHEFIDALDHQGLRAFSVVLREKAAQLD